MDEQCSAGCESHRILQILPGTPGWSVAHWNGSWTVSCSLEIEKSHIAVSPVILWVLVEHTAEDGRVDQSIEPWDARGTNSRELDHWTSGLEYLECNVNFYSDDHCDMRVFGPTQEVWDKINSLTEDDCLKDKDA